MRRIALAALLAAVAMPAWAAHDRPLPPRLSPEFCFGLVKLTVDARVQYETAMSEFRQARTYSPTRRQPWPVRNP